MTPIAETEAASDAGVVYDLSDLNKVDPRCHSVEASYPLPVAGPHDPPLPVRIPVPARHMTGSPQCVAPPAWSCMNRQQRPSWAQKVSGSRVPATTSSGRHRGAPPARTLRYNE